MNKEIDYLLKDITNETFKKIKEKNNNYHLDNLETNRIDVDLNIRYLIKYGIKDIDHVVLDRIDDLLLEHNTFIKKMKDYEQKLTKDGLIEC
ncbi:MAG: hypothetical protein MR598_06470 [Erysipelotrichaceae bacterium]|nr:hypothetical protein [Erysipelotrichaceae bacterium]